MYVSQAVDETVVNNQLCQPATLESCKKGQSTVAEQITFTLADVHALYPSIQLERWMAALRVSQSLKDLCLKLAYFASTFFLVHFSNLSILLVLLPSCNLIMPRR